MVEPLRRVVIRVASLNLLYFGVEFAVALAIGSVSLFADSVDFLEDASINLLIALALGWAATSRARVGMALAKIFGDDPQKMIEEDLARFKQIMETGEAASLGQTQGQCG